MLSKNTSKFCFYKITDSEVRFLSSVHMGGCNIKRLRRLGITTPDIHQLGFLFILQILLFRPSFALARASHPQNNNKMSKIAFKAAKGYASCLCETAVTSTRHPRFVQHEIPATLMYLGNRPCWRLPE